MKKWLMIFCLIFSFANRSTAQAISFQPLSWRDALAKAKAENKMIFIDMFTTWCTYCRQMDQTIFQEAEVANYYNSHFINLKFDAQRGDGIQIRKSYALLGFPTFLYLNADGLVVLKTAGYQEKEKFIKNADSAFLSARACLPK